MILLNAKQGHKLKNSFNSSSNHSLFCETSTEKVSDLLVDNCIKLLDKTINKLENKQQPIEKENTKNHSVKVGDIFYASWGYEQTNIDFYEVIKVIGKCTVIIRELQQETIVYNNSFGGQVIPKKGEYSDDDALRKRINKGYNDQPSIKIFHTTYARPWDGEPKNYTSYA